MIRNSRAFFSSIKLDDLSKQVLNALNAHIAILDKQGVVVAYNKQWHVYQEQLKNKWFRPSLDENFLKSLQLPLADGNDFALRMLIGCKAVLSNEKESFEINYPVENAQTKNWFKATIRRLDEDSVLIIHEDVSNQVQNRQYIRETQQKFNQFFQNNLYGIIVVDEDNRLIEVNKTAADIFEASVESLLYEDISHFINCDADLKSVQKHINRHGNHFGEKEITTAKGNTIPIDLNVTVFRNQEGKAVISWAFIDISDKKRSEKALELSDKRYRLHFLNTREGILIARPEGTILEANPAACEILGYKPEELENKDKSLILDSTNPLNKQAIERWEKDKFFEGEVEYTHKSGRKISAELNLSTYELNNGEKRVIINFRDITSRRTIENQLQEEKKFTESAISSLPNPFFVFDEEGSMVRWNKIFEQDFGYSADELHQLKIFDLVHPDDRERATNYLKQDFKGQTVRLELKCITKEGKTLHYHISGKGFKQNEKHFTVGGGLNLNDLKEIELERKKNSKLLSQLFFNSPIGIVLIDENGKVRNSNKSFESIFGYQVDEIKGKVLDDFIVPPDLNNQAKTLSRSSFTGDSFQTEATRLTKDGREIPVLIGGVPVKVDGEVISIFGMYVDIHERKQLENQIVELLENEKKARHQMEDMFEEAPSAIMMLEGENHKITFANNMAKKWMRRRNLVGKNLPQAVPEMAKHGFMELLQESFKSGQSFQFNEKPIRFKNADRTSYLNLVYKPMRNDDEKVYGIFMQAIDVTEQVEARNIISKSLEEKEILLNEVHHRVKNNLAIVSGLIGLELMENEDSKIAKHLQSTHSRISTIANIHEMLYQNESLSHVSFSEYLEKMLAHISTDLTHSNEFFTSIQLDEIQLNVNQAIPAGILLNEIITFLNDLMQASNTKYGLSFSLKEKNDEVKIEIKGAEKEIIQQFKEQTENNSQLRHKLIDVLLRQIHGKLSIELKEQQKLSIIFHKREVKGAHSALTN